MIHVNLSKQGSGGIGYNRGTKIVLIELYELIVNVNNWYFLFPDGWSELWDCFGEAPDIFQIIQRRYASCNNDFLYCSWNLEHDIPELLPWNAFQVSFAVVERDADLSHA
jgi:hypothetical protein